MDFRQRVLNTFFRRPLDNIVWQPRLEYWFARNKELGTLPARFRDLDLLGLYDALDCSLRPYGDYFPCLEKFDPPRVRRETLILQDGQVIDRHPTEDTQDIFQALVQFTDSIFGRGNARVERITTPLGVLEMHIVYTNRSWHTVKYPIETPDDCRAMKYLLEGTTWRFNSERFAQIDARIGSRTAPMLFLPRVNLMRLFIEFVGFETTIMALHDAPDMVEDLIRAIDATDEPILDVLAACPVPIINFPDNIDQNLCSPTLYQKYVIPAYRRRAARLHAVGKVCDTHWDGQCRLLLPLARSFDVDGIEAITPEPMGDVTIEEMKQALGEDLILLDGIPMTAFEPYTSDQDLERITRRIIEAFAPHLILGISDEPSPTAVIEKIEMVGHIVREYEGKVMDLPRRRGVS